MDRQVLGIRQPTDHHDDDGDGDDDDGYHNGDGDDLPQL